MMGRADRRNRMRAARARVMFARAGRRAEATRGGAGARAPMGAGHGPERVVSSRRGSACVRASRGPSGYRTSPLASSHGWGATCSARVRACPSPPLSVASEVGKDQEPHTCACTVTSARVRASTCGTAHTPPPPLLYMYGYPTRTQISDFPWGPFLNGIQTSAPCPASIPS